VAQVNYVSACHWEEGPFKQGIKKAQPSTNLPAKTSMQGSDVNGLTLSSFSVL
jgi:hypothetical protein